MTSSHRYFKLAVGVVFSVLPMDVNSYLSPVADRNIDMEILVDDFVTFYEAGERVSGVNLSCSCRALRSGYNSKHTFICNHPYSSTS